MMPPPTRPASAVLATVMAAVAPGALQLPKEFVDLVLGLLALSGVTVVLLCTCAVCRRAPGQAQRSAATPKLDVKRRRKAKSYARVAREEELDGEVGTLADSDGELALKDVDGAAYTHAEYVEFYCSKQGAKRWAALAAAAEASFADEAAAQAAAEQAAARETGSKKKRAKQSRRPPER